MTIVWRVTERCNLSCKFCGYDRQLERPRCEADPSAIVRFGAILSEYQKLTADSVLVSWLGGEPLLWRPLAWLTKLFTQQYGLRVSTTTNGTTLSSLSVREHLLDFYSELTISVDGIGDLHDKLRGWPGGYAAVRKGVTALACAKQKNKRGPILRANVLLMRETLPGFRELCFELADWGIEEITFNQLGGNDRPEFFPGNRLLSEQVEMLATCLPELRSVLADRGVLLRGGHAYLNRMVASSRGERLPVIDCRAGETFLFINEEGMAAPCSFTAVGYGVPIDQIAAAMDLLKLPERFATLRAIARQSACDDCHSTQVFEKFAA